MATTLTPNKKTAADVAKYFSHQSEKSCTTLKSIVNDDADVEKNEEEMIDLRICGVGDDAYFEWITEYGNPIGDMFYIYEISETELISIGQKSQLAS